MVSRHVRACPAPTYTQSAYAGALLVPVRTSELEYKMTGKHIETVSRHRSFFFFLREIFCSMYVCIPHVCLVPISPELKMVMNYEEDGTR